jgi:arginine/serine-rich splicing factor 2
VDVARIDQEGVKVYVGNLDFATAERDLDEVFGRFGKLMDVFIPRENRGTISRGFGFVTFYDRRDAEEAVDRLDETDLHGRTIRVNLAKTRPPLDTRRSVPGKETCRDYQRGTCSRGRDCRYAHDGEDDRGRGRGRSRSRSPRRRSRSRSPRRRSRSHSPRRY